MPGPCYSPGPREGAPGADTGSGYAEGGSAPGDSASPGQQEGVLGAGPLQDIVQVSPQTTEFYYYPELLTMAEGRLMMFSTPCCWDIYAQASSDGGLTWSEPGLIVLDGERPDAIQDLNGIIWLVYHRWTGSPNFYDIFLRTSGDGGATWSEEQPLAAGPEHEASVVQTPTGRLIVAYTLGFNHIVYRTSDDGGATWSQPATLAESFSQSVDLAVAQDGTIWAVYFACRFDCGVHSRTSRDGGESWSAESLLDRGGGDPSIATSGGQVLVAYRITKCFPITCTSTILYKRGTPENLAVSPAARFTTHEGRDDSPSVAVLPGGEFGIAWYSSRRLAGGVWNTRNTVWFGIPGEREDLSPPPPP